MERTHSGVARLRLSSEARWEEHLGTQQQARANVHARLHKQRTHIWKKDLLTGAVHFGCPNEANIAMLAKQAGD
jgi:hypothetical protein